MLAIFVQFFCEFFPKLRRTSLEFVGKLAVSLNSETTAITGYFSAHVLLRVFFKEGFARVMGIDRW